MKNLFPDPALTDTGYIFNPPTGGNITLTSGQISLNGAGPTDLIIADGAAFEVPFFDDIAVAGEYYVSFHVANFVQGGLKTKISTPGWTTVPVSGDGWTDPVQVIAGTNRAVGFGLGSSASSTTLDIVPDANGEAIRITTAP